MRRHSLLAMRSTDHADYRQAALPGPFRHFDDHFTNAARGNHNHHILRTEGKVTQDLLGIAGRLLEMKTLAQAVRTDNGIVVGESQLHNRMPAHEATLPRRHLLAHHPAMAAAEQMNEAVAG